MKKYRGLKIIGVIIAALLVIYLFLPSYLKTGIRYLTADIDDYKIFENNVVKAGKHQAWPKAGDYNNFQLNENDLSEFERLETIAFLVIQNGEIKFEQYWMGYNDSSLSNSFSMAKSIVSLLIGVAIDEGKINNVDQTVGDFLTEFNEGDNAKLSIRDLLTMSSGLNWDEAYASPFSKTTQLYYGENIRKLVLGLEVEEEPGKEFHYYSCNTQLLAFILEEAYGKSLNEIASEKLWKPSGAKHDALWSTDKAGGDEKAYCCFNSNARDFARLGQLVLDNGNWNGKQLISEAYVKEATSAASYLAPTEENGIFDFYGYQFWIVDYKGQSIPYFRGILGQYIFMIPDQNAVVVRLGQKRDKAGESSYPPDAILYLDAAMEILTQ